MAGTFLQRSRHGTMFYFRRRVPADLRTIAGRPYIVKSLATEQRREAIILARAFASQSDQLFQEWRSMAKNSDLISMDFSMEFFIDEKGRERVKAVDVKQGEGIDALIAQTATQSLLDGTPIPSQILSLIEVQQKAQLQPMCAPPPARPKGMPFKDAMEFYLAKKGGVSSKNVYRSRLEHAQEHFGEERDVRYIAKSDLREYVAHTENSIKEVGTQIVTVRQVFTFLNYIRDVKDWGGALTTKNILPVKETEDSEDRDQFTLEQLFFVFQFAKKFKEKQPAKYWATIAVAFTGCRIAELGQVNLTTDFHQDVDSGVWFFDINKLTDLDGVIRKSLKNGSSKRKIPIHSALERHGFIDYLHKQLEEGHSRPFETSFPVYILKVKTAKGTEIAVDNSVQYQWGRRLTNWGSYEMTKFREKGMLDDPEGKLTYFHSMRHTFSEEMSNNKIPVDMREAAMGHQFGSKDMERYAKIKQNPVMMSEQAIEPGLANIAALLDKLWEEDSPETAQEAPQSI